MVDAVELTPDDPWWHENCIVDPTFGVLYDVLCAILWIKSQARCQSASALVHGSDRRHARYMPYAAAQPGSDIFPAGTNRISSPKQGRPANLEAMASNLEAMASNLIAMASNLGAMGSYLIAKVSEHFSEPFRFRKKMLHTCPLVNTLVGQPVPQKGSATDWHLVVWKLEVPFFKITPLQTRGLGWLGGSWCFWWIAGAVSSRQCGVSELPRKMGHATKVGELIYQTHHEGDPTSPKTQ